MDKESRRPEIYMKKCVPFLEAFWGTRYADAVELVIIVSSLNKNRRMDGKLTVHTQVE